MKRPASSLLLLVVLTAASPPSETGGVRFPVVFTARSPIGERGLVPGLGPHQRASVHGGRLLLRTVKGGTEGFGDRDRVDVGHLSVAPDGRTIAFAAAMARDSSWRVLTTGRRDGDAVTAGRLDIPESHGRSDDLSPCWVDDTTLVFISTRDGQRSEYDGSPVAQLFRFDLPSKRLTRLTAERNGVDAPSLDRRTGRIVYSRWWFNRTRPPGETSDDTVNVWQAISIRADGTDPRLVARRARATRRESLTQPVIARDGSLYGTLGDNSGLSPSPGKTEIVRIRPGSDQPEHIAGAYIDPTITSRYGSTRGLASPSACCPQPLDDGRVLFSLDAGARGDWGVWVANADGSNAKPLVDLPGTLELDAVPLAPWKAIPAPPPRASLDPLPRTMEELGPPRATFRFLDRNVFGAGFGAKQAAAARAAGPVRIRFWAALARPEIQGGDTVVLVREAPVSKNGRVDEDGLPAGVPMFEQLLDAHGSVLRSAHGAAHVAGFNFGRPGQTASCVGCHRGHSLAK